MSPIEAKIAALENQAKYVEELARTNSAQNRGCCKPVQEISILPAAEQTCCEKAKGLDAMLNLATKFSGNPGTHSRFTHCPWCGKLLS